MAVKKATTTADLTASATDPQPTRDELVDQVTTVSDPDMVAKVDAPKTVKVKSPTGAVTEVPETIVDSLLDSGYSKTR